MISDRRLRNLSLSSHPEPPATAEEVRELADAQLAARRVRVVVPDLVHLSQRRPHELSRGQVHASGNVSIQDLVFQVGIEPNENPDAPYLAVTLWITDPRDPSPTQSRTVAFLEDPPTWSLRHVAISAHAMFDLLPSLATERDVLVSALDTAANTLWTPNASLTLQRGRDPWVNLALMIQVLGQTWTGETAAPARYFCEATP